MSPVPLILGIIPARAESSRYPNKVLVPILGRPMLEWVWDAAVAALGVDRVWIATDSPVIAAEGRRFGATVVETGRCESGTDRVHQALLSLTPRLEGVGGDPVVLNLQADEPCLTEEVVRALARELILDASASMATLATPLRAKSQWADSNVVKVEVQGGFGVRFLRQVDPAEQESGRWFKHVGVYGYRASSLAKFSSLPQTMNEKVHRLEQYRALDHGMRIRVARIESDTVGVDVPEDRVRAEAFLMERN